MGDVREGPRVDEDGRVLDGLEQRRLDGVAQQHRHGPRRAELLGRDGLAVLVEADHDAAEPLAKIF